jgi:hypothetical protein
MRATGTTEHQGDDERRRCNTSDHRGDS